jgi:hypothetical protein
MRRGNCRVTSGPGKQVMRFCQFVLFALRTKAASSVLKRVASS